MTINRLLRPELPEGRATHLQEGFIMGWVPGEISSLDDPEKIGRVRVRCDILHENKDLPNNDDGWVWVMEPFTSNGIPGGSHTFLQVGSQVALIPMFGDPKQMLLIGCLANRVDRPHPEFDRSRKIYGTATPGQVFTLKNDKEASRIDAYPHGVLQQISKTGDITQQTVGKARLQLKADANVRIENNKSFTALTPDGTVKSSSAKGASSTLGSDGKILLSSSNMATLALNEVKAKIEGPSNSISSLLKTVQGALGGQLGDVQKTLNELQRVAESALKGDHKTFLNVAMNLLGTLDKDLAKFLPQGLDAIGQLNKLDVSTLGKVILPQVDKALNLNLGTYYQEIEKLLNNKLDPESLISTLQKTFPNLKGIEKALPIIKNINKPEIQIQAILAEIVPFQDIQNLIGGNFLRNSGDIQGIINQAIQLIDKNKKQSLLSHGVQKYDDMALSLFLQENFSDVPEKHDDLLTAIKDYGVTNTENTNTQKPQSLVDFINKNFVDFDKEIDLLSDKMKSIIPVDTGLDSKSLSNILKTADTKNPWIDLLGSQAKQSLNGSEKAIKDISKKSKAITGLNQFVQDVGDKYFNDIQDAVLKNKSFINPELKKAQESIMGMLKDVFGAKLNIGDLSIDKFLPMAAKFLNQEISPLLKTGMGEINKLINLIPQGIKGAVVEASQTMAEMKTQLGGAGAIARVQSMSAEMIGPGGVTSLFAGMESAGIKTPWGSFDLGSEGGSLISQGKMALKVLQDIGGSAGISLHPKEGASLASYFPAKANEASFAINQSARITTEGQTVKIESLNPGGSVNHAIIVSPTGIFLDNIDIHYLAELPYKLSALEARLTAIESMQIPMVP